MAFFAFSPNNVAAGIFTGLFALTSVAHMYLIIKTRAWFMGAFLLGSLLETCGYIFRIVSHTYPYSLGPFLTQTLLILLAPPLISASLYMVVGRLARATNSESYLLLPRKYISAVFIIFDVFSFFLQAAGGGMMSLESQSSKRRGKSLVIAGLFIQLAAFGIFTLTTILFDIRRRKSGFKLLAQSKTLKWLLITMYAVSALIIVRSIVRTVEYIQGYSGYIIKHEVFIYVFDALLMFIAILLFVVVHPGMWLHALREEFNPSDHDNSNSSDLVQKNEIETLNIQHYFSQNKEL
ncbi:putative RTM1-like protein [Nadsonia fulvescens var. elongata DSM 6958]|uniref:Putative RTM1-like protein n=1 Tax=Nadsonia fulvescens var. elongata DSM 6958 TaxID=857566 RepID=A0A1E3PQH3_9ASCO|nr:putative RTM1-like protein [Nadsonia fulvescens var. elongata DSM 6958]